MNIFGSPPVRAVDSIQPSRTHLARDVPGPITPVTAGGVSAIP